MKTFKLIISAPSSANYNMELDKKIFEQYLENGVGVLRLYRWERPSFTYGFSQNPENEIDLLKCKNDGVQIAKRMTGGGILFHQDEITYSFVCCKSDVKEPGGVFVDYRNICKFLIRFYELLGLAPTFALQGKDFKNKSVPSEICSAAHEKYDIVIGAKKIGGNAQKRKRQVIFQHGSIPCSVDWNFVYKYLKFLPKNISEYVTTLRNELSIVPEKNILEQKLITAFKATFGINFIQEDPVSDETCLA